MTMITVALILTNIGVLFAGLTLMLMNKRMDILSEQIKEINNGRKTNGSL